MINECELVENKLPVGWEIRNLSSFCEKPQYGYTDSSAESGNVKFLRITDITSMGVNWNNVPYCNCPENKLQNYTLAEGDIVFARIGATTGKSYLINKPPKAVFASYLIRIRTKPTYNSEYLFYYFNSEFYWKQINANKGGKLKGGINGSILSDLKVIFPTSSEQRKIAHVLSTVQSAIEQQDKFIRTTTELKKALMQKLFTEGTRGESQRESEIGLVPESWEIKEIGDFSKLYTGGTPSTKNENYYNPKVIPWMKSGEITGKRIKSVSNFISNEGMNSSNARLLPTDSVVIALNGRGKTRGTTSILDFECTCNQSVVCISPNSKDELNTEFLHNYLSYLYDFIRNLTGNNDRSGLSMAKIRQIPLMVPEITEQIEIGNVFRRLDDKIEILEKRKQNLNALFKTLLHELMTGQRRVHEMDFDEINIR